MKPILLLLLFVASLYITTSCAQETEDSREFSALRTWTDSTGERTFSGKVTKYDGTNVTISRAGKSTLTFPIDKLSETDRKWLEENKDSINKPAPSLKKTGGTPSLMEKQFQNKTYGLNEKRGIGDAISLSWSKKPLKTDAKYYIILYSASWCPPCRKHMPDIATLYKEKIVKDPDIELILLAVNSPDEKITAWLKEVSGMFPVLPSDKRDKVPVARDTHNGGVPCAYLVNDKGEVQGKGLPKECYDTYLGLKQ